MGAVVPFESRSAKPSQARGPTSIGPRPRNRSARPVAVASAAYGFGLAAAIEVEAFALAVLLIVAGFYMLRRLR